MVPIDIRVHERFGEIDAEEWDCFIEAVGAPAFYSSAFLSAYERSPLQAAQAIFYIVLRERAGKQLLAVLPAYLQSIDDPAGDVSSVVKAPETGSGLILLTHVVHCYDSYLPSVELNSMIVGKIVAALADLAAQTRADYFGFLHVDAASPLPELLREVGMRIVPMESRFNRNVTEFKDVDGYIAAMPSSKARRNLRRCYRQAGQHDMTVEVGDGTVDHLASAVELCHLTAAQHGTPTYYPPATMPDFIAGLGTTVDVISVKQRDVLIAAAISLKDRYRYHFWACGIRAGEYGPISPFSLLFHRAIHETTQAGIPVLECGRGNEIFKYRHGLRPVPTLGCLSQP
jgi:predicted N-acyltransferase